MFSMILAILMMPLAFGQAAGMPAEWNRVDRQIIEDTRDIIDKLEREDAILEAAIEAFTADVDKYKSGAMHTEQALKAILDMYGACGLCEEERRVELKHQADLLAKTLSEAKKALEEAERKKREADAAAKAARELKAAQDAEAQKQAEEGGDRRDSLLW